MNTDQQKIWVDGEIVDEVKTHQSLLTHALHYGTSVYDGIRFYDTGHGIYAFRLSDHIDRLIYSAGQLGLKISWSKRDIIEAVIATVNINKLKNGYIRPIIFSGVGILTMDTRNRSVVTAVIALSDGKYLPKEMIALKTVSIHRPISDAFNLRAKMGGVYVNSILAHQEAVDGGADEALMLTHNLEVAEGPGENIFIVKGGVFYTPPDDIILPGITRDTVIRLCRKNSIRCRKTDLTIDQVHQADECFLTGTAAEITPVTTIDGITISDQVGPLTSLMQGQFSNVTHGLDPTFKKWNTLIRSS